MTPYSSQSRAELFDFHQPKDVAKSTAYAFLFEWIRDYFRQRQQDTIIHPLYLQHQGKPHVPHR